jgi:hypothetical protein
MAVEIGQIHKGMRVHASDGTELGKVQAMWPGIDPTSASVRCDEEVCSRIEVRQGKGRQVRTLYIPHNAVEGVSGDVVTLSVSTETIGSRAWVIRPAWIPSKGSLVNALSARDTFWGGF